MELNNAFQSPDVGPFNKSTFTKGQVQKKQRDLRNWPLTPPQLNLKKSTNDLPLLLGLILLFIISICLYYIKQRTMWSIYTSYKNPPKLMDTFIIGLMVMCWPFYYLKYYLL